METLVKVFLGPVDILDRRKTSNNECIDRGIGFLPCFQKQIELPLYFLRVVTDENKEVCVMSFLGLLEEFQQKKTKTTDKGILLSNLTPVSLSVWINSKARGPL